MRARVAITVAFTCLWLVNCRQEDAARHAPAGGADTALAVDSPTRSAGPRVAGDGASPGADAPPDSASTSGTTRGPRPPAKSATIQLEGFDEPFTLILTETPPGFPLPFSTYVPADMLAEGTAAQMSFVANFGAKRNDAAALRILPRPAGAGEDEARRAARALQAGRGGTAGESRGSRRFSWAIAEYGFGDQGGRAHGVVAVGQHAQRYFLVVLEYPPEYGDGFGPRAYRVLEELRWADDGTGLRRR